MTVRLRRATLSDMAARSWWMSDPATMSDNSGFDLPHPGYHRDTGCIDFPEQEWARWLGDVDGCRDRFFLSIVDADGIAVGEVAFRVIDDEAHLHVLVSAAHGGRGYGTAALALLLAEAFARPDVTAAVNEFPSTRESAETVHRRWNFARTGTRLTLPRTEYERRHMAQRAPEVEARRAPEAEARRAPETPARRARPPSAPSTSEPRDTVGS